MLLPDSMGGGVFLENPQRRTEEAKPHFALTQMSATAICHRVSAKSPRLPRKCGWGRAGVGKRGVRISKPLGSAHLQSEATKTSSNCAE